MAGFAAQIRRESNINTKDIMLDYFQGLFEDANDFAWSSAKKCHSIVCCRVEEATLAWDDELELDRCRRSYAQRHPPQKSEPVKKSEKRVSNSQKSSQSKKIVACHFYQNSKCNRFKDHESVTTVYKHICLNCFRGGEHIRHKESECPKNG